MTIFESTDIAAIRNVALVGASATGKTTLTEALLLRAGAIKTAGCVERGSTVSDHDPLEKRVGSVGRVQPRCPWCWLCYAAGRPSG